MGDVDGDDIDGEEWKEMNVGMDVDVEVEEGNGGLIRIEKKKNTC